MPKTSSSIFATLKNIIRSKFTMSIVAALIVGVGGYFIFFNHSLTYQFVMVQKGSIAESVSLTGNTTPAQSVSLSFGSSGIVSHTYTSLGKQVNAGQVLAELNKNDLTAQLHQAQANVDQQQARLAGLKSGARPEDIALYTQKYADASSALTIAMNTAYLQTENAIRRYADTLFANGVLKVKTQSWDEERSIEMDRIIVGEKLSAWQKAVASITVSSDKAELSNARSVGKDAIVFITSFLNHLSTIVGNLSPSGSGMSQTDIDTDRLNSNTAAQTVSSVASAEQNAYAAWTAASQTLLSQESGSKPEDIAAQAAAVMSAQASVDSVTAKIENAEISAPISGIITQFDAKIGQLASPSAPLVSIMSNTGYEVDAGISETDIGKVQVGNIVSMTLDAFPNETFAGTVFYIAPSQTNTQSVISYQIKISFTKADPRLKSGLTANIDIQTKKKDSVLLLPQYAILQNDTGTFVETLAGKIVTTSPVTLGIQDQKGNVEILSGVTEGEQVINIGLKAQ